MKLGRVERREGRKGNIEGGKDRRRKVVDQGKLDDTNRR